MGSIFINNLKKIADRVGLLNYAGIISGTLSSWNNSGIILVLFLKSIRFAFSVCKRMFIRLRWLWTNTLYRLGILCTLSSA